MTRAGADVAVVGAGPQGLAVVAHLRESGIEARVFGETMGFWERHMPIGMFLRSSPRASNISDPRRERTFRHFANTYAGADAVPIPIARFIEYGRWFQRAVVPDLDPRMVVRIERAADGFTLSLDDGETVLARRVIVAAGLAGFSWRPTQFDGFPISVVSHAVDHRDMCGLSGRRVAIVGGGQSALESAALLDEAGAEVEVIVRSPGIRWLKEVPDLRGPVERRLLALLFPPTEVGPLPLNWVAAAPGAFHKLPEPIRQSIAQRCIRPAVATWLRKRVRDVRVTTERRIAAITLEAGGARLRLEDGTERRVDHVLLATGYRVDVTRYEFLTGGILRTLSREHGYPILGAGLESSVPGLHFVGAAAAHSFGPVMRFVAGGAYAARAITRHVRNQPPELLGWSW